MKKAFTFISFLLLSHSLISQQDSITIEYRKETGELDSLSYIDAYDYVFMRHVETKSLWKITIIETVKEDLNYGSIGAIFLPFVSYERKLSPNTSLNTAFHLSPVIFINESPHFRVADIGLSIEPRLYLNMLRKIASGESADNLSGNYLGLQMGYSRYQYAEHLALPDKNAYFAFVNFGIQRRLLRRGFIDIRAGLGAAYKEMRFLKPDFFFGGGEKWQPTFQLQATLGFAFGEGNPDQGRLCEALLCYQENRQMFRIDLIQLTQRVDENSYRGKLGLAYEHKLGQSPFSLNLVADVGLNHVNFKGFKAANALEWEASLEHRFYYNLRKRMAQGKSVNNLSANYIALRMGRGQTDYYHPYYQPDLPTRVTLTRLFLSPVWGIQRRIFRNGYAGYQLGLNFIRERRKGRDYEESWMEGHSRFQLGLAF